jgi:hypothetical protein
MRARGVNKPANRDGAIFEAVCEGEGNEKEQTQQPTEETEPAASFRLPR